MTDWGKVVRQLKDTDTELLAEELETIEEAQEKTLRDVKSPESDLRYAQGALDMLENLAYLPEKIALERRREEEEEDIES